MPASQDGRDLFQAYASQPSDANVPGRPEAARILEGGTGKINGQFLPDLPAEIERFPPALEGRATLSEIVTSDSGEAVTPGVPAAC